MTSRCKYFKTRLGFEPTNLRPVTHLPKSRAAVSTCNRLVVVGAKNSLVHCMFVAARLVGTDLPEDVGVAVEPFLGGYPILPEDMDIADLTPAQIHEMNQKLLEESMESGRPLLSPPEATTVLQDEYSDSPNFLAQIDSLITQGYRIIIRAKGDGNCFYRALAFAYLDRLIRLPGRNKEDRLAATKDILAIAGFDESVYDQPYEILQTLAQQPHQPRRAVNEELLQHFMDPSTSNYIVWYMRLLTSAQMHVDNQFADFLFDPETQMQISVDDFCRQFVEPLGKEADHIQVAALAQALDVRVKVAYLDGRTTDGHVNFVDSSENVVDSAEPLVLLYRPGHYDILQRSV